VDVFLLMENFSSIRNFFFLRFGFLPSSGLLAVRLFFWLFFCCFL
jgi:hypothetical protein